VIVAVTAASIARGTEQALHCVAKLTE